MQVIAILNHNAIIAKSEEGEWVLIKKGLGSHLSEISTLYLGNEEPISANVASEQRKISKFVFTFGLPAPRLLS